MDTRVGNSNFRIPPASLGIFDTLSVVFWVPVYDRIIVPVARKFTGHENGLTQLQRMGFGLFLSIFSMLSQYFIIGCAEVFTIIGQLEFFYEQAPDAMRSLCSALQLTTVALGNYLSALLVTIVTGISTRDGEKGWIPDNLNYGRVDYFYHLLAVLSVLNLAVFLLVAKWYTYKRPVGTLR